MRTYTINNNIVPSVTTVLSILGSNKLVAWANRQGFKGINTTEYTKSKAEFGTFAHEAIHELLDPNYKSNIKPIYKNTIDEINSLIISFKTLTEDMNYKTLYCEKEIVSLEFGYGGTIDWICEIDNKIVIFDFKTSKFVKPTMIIQLAAYIKLLKTININVDKAGIILVSPSSSEIKYMNMEEIKNAENAFMYLLQFYNLFGDKLF